MQSVWLRCARGQRVPLSRRAGLDTGTRSTPMLSSLTWLYWVLFAVTTVRHVLPSPQRATKIAQSATEILYIEDGYPGHLTYKLEDFFWTGSGDGASENPWDESESPTTIYKTKTVLSTVYVSTSNNNQTVTETESPSECAINCQSITIPDEEIRPTPTFENYTIVPPFTNRTNMTDRHFWLLTVIRTDGKEPVVAVLEKRLAKLYSVAFRRQQERHLGIEKRPKRQTPKNNQAENKPVNVCIHNIAQNEEKNEVEVLYHVLVSGKPVAAVTAASDMRLVSNDEVAKELGFPVLTKAEPFLKSEHPENLSRTKDVWLFIGVALATIFLLLLMVTIFTFCLNKHKRIMSPTDSAGITNRQQIFENESGEGQVNVGYVDGQDDNMKTYQSGRRHRKTPFRPRNTTSNETLTNWHPDGRPTSSGSSTTISSNTSSDILPLVLPMKHRSSQSRKRQRVADKRATAVNKALIHKQDTVQIETDSSISHQDSETALVKDSESRGRISPKSYLSMPSIKSFPRSSIPETLNKVLEPVSVLHLDMTDDVIPEPSPVYTHTSRKPFVRHTSTGSEDPGVIGPIVWNLHCKRMQNGTKQGVGDVEGQYNPGAMRKRFHELLDDTFSLFGTSKDGQADIPGSTSSSSNRHVEPRGQSAVVRPSTESSTALRPRPKTSDPRRIAPSPGLDPPKGAWGSGTPSPLVRPLSAGPFHRPIQAPIVEVERILADGTLPPTDPAVPLIAAIKTELHKCSLPGSTTNLVE